MNAVWAARQAGVERIVRLSVVGAAHDAPNRSGRLHALSDRETERCGMRWTILRPHWFMRNLLLGYGVPRWIVDMLEEYAQAYESGWGDFTTDTVADLLGRPARDIADFARDHAAAFASTD
jgi:uncharacterized protein YbjT (DUF2867 family)